MKLNHIIPIMVAGLLPGTVALAEPAATANEAPLPPDIPAEARPYFTQHQSLQANIREMSELLGSVCDRRTADAAAPKLKAAYDRLMAELDALDAMTQPPPEVMKQLESKLSNTYAQSVTVVQLRMAWIRKMSYFLSEELRQVLEEIPQEEPVKMSPSEAEWAALIEQQKQMLDSVESFVAAMSSVRDRATADKAAEILLPQVKAWVRLFEQLNMIDKTKITEEQAAAMDPFRERVSSVAGLAPILVDLLVNDGYGSPAMQQVMGYLEVPSASNLSPAGQQRFSDFIEQYRLLCDMEQVLSTVRDRESADAAAPKLAERITKINTAREAAAKRSAGYSPISQSEQDILLEMQERTFWPFIARLGKLFDQIEDAEYHGSQKLKATLEPED